MLTREEWDELSADQHWDQYEASSGMQENFDGILQIILQTDQCFKEKFDAEHIAETWKRLVDIAQRSIQTVRLMRFREILQQQIVEPIEGLNNE